MSGAVAAQLEQHLIRGDGQEDLSFALWNPSAGAERDSALVSEAVLPIEGEREIHGNVSFLPQYLERTCLAAIQKQSGIAFLHSHPFPGWQGMSEDDVKAEQKMAPAVLSLTGYPLIGLTVASDRTWSARVWLHASGREYRRQWCSSVRIAGQSLKVDFADELRPRPVFRDMFRRTLAMWGPENHARLARLRVGIIGLGSVGSLVAETLARMGCEDLVLVDFDLVETHNLDRLVTASEEDIGRLKVDVAEDRVRLVGTADAIKVRAVPHSVAEEDGYKAALDCDVLFSCVDRPRARHILNHIAYGHLIPVIDGGIVARFRGGAFRGADWQVQTVGPGRTCLQCLGTYDAADVSTEAAGKLDDPSYLSGLPADHRFKRNENVFPFSTNLASLEVLQLVALVTGAAGIYDFGVQRYRYVPGILEQLADKACEKACDTSTQSAIGDKYFTLSGRDLTAEATRERRHASVSEPVGSEAELAGGAQ